MGSQSSVPWDTNGVVWLAQKWLTLFAFVALIKILGCQSMQWTWHKKTWSRRSFATLRATNASRIGVNSAMHCNSERISWSETHRTWRWWEIQLLSVGHYGSSNIDNFYSHLWRMQRGFQWCYWWFNKTFLYRQAKYYQFLIQDEI